MKYIVTILITFFLISCGDNTNLTKSSQDYGLEEQNNTSKSSYKKVDTKIFFSKTSGAYYNGGVDNNITNDIKNAKKSIYMAMYDLTNSMITQALIDAKNRGVNVKVTTDDKKIKEDRYQELIDAGILVSDDQNPNALMHNKFLVIDNKILWSGSGNYTVYSFYRNYENYIRVANIDIANGYIKEFNLLNSNSKQSYKSFSINNIDIYFSPDSNFESVIIKYIKSAKKSIYFLAFSFTSKDIADALIEAKNRGVIVKGVFDQGQNSYQKESKYDYLLQNDIDVKLDQNSNKLHSKVIIIDKNITITGSYNFTKSANYNNNENSLVIKDSNIALKYKSNFDTIFNPQE